MWHAFEVILRLRSPLHIGCGKVGNLQRTRPYVTGRALWGALTMRLTRDVAQGHGPAADSLQYRQVGEQVNQYLAFTYFYPALKVGNDYNDYQVAWPWENEHLFRHRFLSSYQGTALSYPQQSAAEGMLHEVEFISPYTLDTGQPVFLKGYIFEQAKCPQELDWRSACKRLQIGGERGYGWGNVELVTISQCNSNELFSSAATFEKNSDRPVISIPQNGRLLAHTQVKDVAIAGDVEPLVGREWRSDNSQHRYRYAGQHVEVSDFCFVPGSMTQQTINYKVMALGIWHLLT